MEILSKICNVHPRYLVGRSSYLTLYFDLRVWVKYWMSEYDDAVTKKESMVEETSMEPLGW